MGEFSFLTGSEIPMSLPGGKFHRGRAASRICFIHSNLAATRAGQFRRRKPKPKTQMTDPITFWNKVLLDCNLRDHTAAGHAYGDRVAREMIKARDKDGSELDPPHAHSDNPGAHRPDPDGPPTMPSLGASWGNVKPFIARPHRLAPFPPLGSPEYDAAAEEVRKKGATPDYLDLTRTPDETTKGVFWAYDGVTRLGTPPRLYFQIIRDLCDKFALDTHQRARLFGLVAAALGDARIQA